MRDIVSPLSSIEDEGGVFMFQFFVNAEGGLTGAGYAVCVTAGLVLFLLAIIFAGKGSEKNKMTTRQLVFCAMAMALAFVTSYVKIFEDRKSVV